MSNYKEEVINGVSVWTRCNEVFIYNPTDGAKIIRFNEEEITKVGTRSFTKPAGALTFEFDPAKEIQEVSSMTGEATGRTFTLGEIYNILHSAYVQLATERDVRETAEAEERERARQEQLARISNNS